MAAWSGTRKGNQRRPKKRLKALAEFILCGGPQPYASIISAVCEAFNCTPTEALKQDLVRVREVLDGRMAEAAKAQHNADVQKMSEGQAEFWLELMEALN